MAPYTYVFNEAKWISLFNFIHCNSRLSLPSQDNYFDPSISFVGFYVLSNPK